jgi:Transcription factor WhiB
MTSKYVRRNDLPPSREMAALLATGETLRSLADHYRCAPATIRARLRADGYTETLHRIDDPPSYRTFEPPDIDSTEWRNQAACDWTFADMFYLSKRAENGPTRTRQINAAKHICHSCPVEGACLEWALTTGEPDGIWGGLTPRERHKLRRKGHAA